MKRVQRRTSEAGRRANGAILAGDALQGKLWRLLQRGPGRENRSSGDCPMVRGEGL